MATVAVHGDGCGRCGAIHAVNEPCQKRVVRLSGTKKKPAPEDRQESGTKKTT